MGKHPWISVIFHFTGKLGISAAAWLKQSNKNLSCNSYLIRDQFSCSPASNKCLQSNAPVTVWGLCVTVPAWSALTWSSVLPAMLAKWTAGWIKEPKQQDSTKKSIQRDLWLSPVKWQNGLIFFSSSKVKPCWPPSEPQLYSRGLAPCLITRTLSMMEPIFK